MKRLLLSMVALIALSGNVLAQSYDSDTLPKQFITTYDQNFPFTFSGLPAGGFGTGYLVVYFEGDFGDNGENIIVRNEDNVVIGTTVNTGMDCSPRDSAFIAFDASMIDTWAADGDVDFVLQITSNVDPGLCTVMYVQARLVYDYCAFGTPQEFASFTLTDNRFCNYDAPVTLTGSPANGTFTGDGVSANTFDPQGLTPGTSHVITYTATDDIGCTTSASATIYINRAPQVQDLVACPGTAASLTINAGGTFVWFEDSGLTSVIDTGNVVASPVIYETTDFYVANLNTTLSMHVDSLGTSSSMVVDHDMMSGDDRGGIAITEQYIYVVGDQNTVRANASNLTGQVSLPRRDALFSNLATGNLYTLWNTDLDTDPNYDDSYIEVNAIRAMDENLALGDEINMLSTPFMVDYYSLILAGNGFVGVISSDNSHAYIIDLDDFSVQDLGEQANMTNYGSENWADWGVLEFDGADFFALYRTYNGSQILRRNLTTGTETTLATFAGGISDLSSFTVSPWNNRWYFHYEGNGIFGGTSETMGYAAAGITTDVLENNELGCYSEVEVFVSNIDLGADTTVCQYNTPVVLFAGLGYTSYTWNGVNNDYNAFPATAEGQYIVNATDIYNCTISDTINVIFDECLGLNENALETSMSVFPNPTRENIVISFQSEMTSAMTVVVTDLSGKVLQQNSFTAVSGNNAYTIETSQLASGTYIIRAAIEGVGAATQRFIKL